nr:immunoglobulin light chain junction region [Macaca mulatta]MOX79636.1 immunoglobulin light chain junction region [Macaca mulatta]MOX79957.1 immunoglobulin light chain junction region [Macaca mulatta]MOX80207.1 immunoglobulin light chain junction region [Macaca mulatta]MOX80354.1 immunoglobulin light chain junction region [Macaca mulatta]
DYFCAIWHSSAYIF